jgi:long-chain acyl-CoA synthetase
MDAGRTSAPPAVVEKAASVPGLLLRQAVERGTDVAMRDRHRGRWRETTWLQYAQRTARAGLALAELGIRPGDRVAILARNRPEWVIADLAIQGIGAISVGICPTLAASEVQRLIGHSGARMLLAEDEEQAEKAPAVRDRLTELERIVVMDAGVFGSSAVPRLASFSELEGAVPERHAVEDWADHAERLDPGSIATIVYGTGTTGSSGGVMLTHANLTWAAATLREALGARPNDNLVAADSLCRIVERVASVATAVDAGYVVHFGERDSFPQELRDVQPTLLVVAGQVWEALLAGDGSRTADIRSGGTRPGDALLRRSERKRLGLSRVRVALATHPMAPEVLDAFLGMGVEVREAYGRCENTFICTLAAPGAGRPGTVGQVLAGVEVQIVSDAEVLVRSPGVFAGYLADEPATRAALDPSGWLRTGDLGMFDADGFLTITGTKRRMHPG